jgi:hypothetical protein
VAAANSPVFDGSKTKLSRAYKGVDIKLNQEKIAKQEAAGWKSGLK